MEQALADELAEIAHTTASATLKVHNQVPGGVHCSGSMVDAYRVNLHSRIASRVLMRMANRTYANENDIYDLVLEQPWEDWFGVDNTIRVDITAIKSEMNVDARPDISVCKFAVTLYVCTPSIRIVSGKIVIAFRLRISCFDNRSPIRC